MKCPANRSGSHKGTTLHGSPPQLDAGNAKAGTPVERTVFCICICLQIHAPIDPLTARHSLDGCVPPSRRSVPSKILRVARKLGGVKFTKL